MSQKATVLALVIFSLMSLPALADDWRVTRMRGTVYVAGSNGWERLLRGATVPDEMYIRTMANGQVELTRGNEVLTLRPDTQIRIDDREAALPYTIVTQHFGTLKVEAEEREVTHFEVKTPTLAAVVKGTKFTVSAGDDGDSVEVLRGLVYVEDSVSQASVVLAVGQEASISKGGPLAIAGPGKLPTVVDAKGKPVVKTPIGDKAQAAIADAAENGKKIGKGDRAGNDDKPGKPENDDKPSMGYKPGSPAKRTGQAGMTSRARTISPARTTSRARTTKMKSPGKTKSRRTTTRAATTRAKERVARGNPCIVDGYTCHRWDRRGCWCFEELSGSFSLSQPSTLSWALDTRSGR